MIRSDLQATGELTQGGATVQDRIQSILQQSLVVAGLCVLVASVLEILFVSGRIVELLQDLTEVSRRLLLGSYRERTTSRLLRSFGTKSNVCAASPWLIQHVTAC
jgi:hypothetical protein